MTEKILVDFGGFVFCRFIKMNLRYLWDGSLPFLFQFKN